MLDIILPLKLNSIKFLCSIFNNESQNLVRISEPKTNDITAKINRRTKAIPNNIL